MSMYFSARHTLLFITQQFANEAHEPDMSQQKILSLTAELAGPQLSRGSWYMMRRDHPKGLKPFHPWVKLESTLHHPAGMLAIGGNGTILHQILGPIRMH